jgi:hypothetical protein
MTRHAKAARPPRPITDEEYAQLCDCRCKRVRGTHPAGVCAQIRAATSARDGVNR